MRPAAHAAGCPNGLLQGCGRTFRAGSGPKRFRERPLSDALPYLRAGAHADRSQA